jgi:hypothetical protein
MDDDIGLMRARVPVKKMEKTQFGFSHINTKYDAERTDQIRFILKTW